jgi:hypothetical protein
MWENNIINHPKMGIAKLPPIKMVMTGDGLLLFYKH